jgi:hypothetical protein
MKSAGGSSTGSEIQATPQGCEPRNAGAPDAPARLPIARDLPTHTAREWAARYRYDAVLNSVRARLILGRLQRHRQRA